MTGPGLTCLWQVSVVIVAATAMHHWGDERTQQAVEAALNPLLDRRVPDTDEALAVLVAFYIGEHFGEDLACDLWREAGR